MAGNGLAHNGHATSLENRAFALTWRASLKLPAALRHSLHKRLEKIVLTDTVHRCGQSFRLSAAYRQRVWWADAYENALCEWLARHTQTGDYILDVGAQIGCLSVFLGLLTGPAGHVDAVEPLLDNYLLLQRNIADNQLENIVTPHEACCDAHDGGVWLSTSQDSRTLNFDDVPVPVPALTVDGLALHHGRLDLLRIDTGGNELQVLQGAAIALRKFRPKLIITLYPPMAAEAVAFMTARDYHATDLCGQQIWPGDLLLRAGNQDEPPFHIVFLP